MLDVISKCFEQPDEIRTFLSKALPQVIVVQTDVNWAVSTSGYTPSLFLWKHQHCRSD